MSAIKILTATFLIGKRNSCLFETVCETKESKEMKYYCVINNRDLISYGNKSRKLVEDYKEQFCDDTVKIIELQSKSDFDVVVKTKIADKTITEIHEITLRQLNPDVVVDFINSKCKEYFENR